LKIEVAKVRIDGGTQMRATIDEQVVAEYADLYRGKVAMPEIACAYDGVDHWLVDGFHRWHAMQAAGIKWCSPTVTSASRTEAQWMACGMNMGHGLRRSNADKRKAVLAAFALRPEASDRAIAEHCGVSPGMVGDWRPAVDPPEVPAKRPGKAARTPQDEPPPADAPTAPQEPAAPAAPLLDAYGRTVPGPVYEDWTMGREWCARWLRDEAALVEELTAMLDTTIGKTVAGAKVKSYNERLRYIVREQMTPHAICPLCSGKGCKTCHHRGWHTEETWRVVPDEYRTKKAKSAPAKDDEAY